MAFQPKNRKQFSRRSVLPFLGTAILIPLFGFGKSGIDETSDAKDEEYQTLLKPDGTTVRVKISTIKKSRVIKKNISNTSFLNWLGKKL